MTEQWFEICAYNSEALYGYGTQAEADEFASLLSLDREVNAYGSYPLTEAEANELSLEERTDTFRLDDELAARRDG